MVIYYPTIQIMDKSLLPLFVDRETDGIHTEGGNGKSLVMGSVEHWKKTLNINGKNIHKDDKFLFSGVNLILNSYSLMMLEMTLILK